MYYITIAMRDNTVSSDEKTTVWTQGLKRGIRYSTMSKSAGVTCKGALCVLTMKCSIVHVV